MCVSMAGAVYFRSCRCALIDDVEDRGGEKISMNQNESNNASRTWNWHDWSLTPMRKSLHAAIALCACDSAARDMIGN